jgi:hypothetical protein
MPKQNSKQRGAIPRSASVQIDREHLARLWSLTPAEREAAARRGEFSLGDMWQWSARCPQEVELVDGEFWFLAIYTPEHAD